jgi:hypothetical protein
MPFLRKYPLFFVDRTGVKISDFWLNFGNPEPKSKIIMNMRPMRAMNREILLS